MRRFLVVLALAGCAQSEANPKDEVSVELAAVTLGDDCGGMSNVPAPPAPKKDADADGKRRSDNLPDTGYCSQTMMQLAVKTTAGAKATTIKVKKVELLDAKGKSLESLESQQPAKWNGKKYIAWDEKVAPNEVLQTSYVLASPKWSKHNTSRRAAAGKMFQVRLTLVVGTQNRTLEKQAVVAAYIEPDIDT